MYVVPPQIVRSLLYPRGDGISRTHSVARSERGEVGNASRNYDLSQK